MKISKSLLALLAAGFLGHGAFGSTMNDNAAPLGFAVTPDGHGGSHFMYFQTAAGDMNTTTVALSTSSGGVISSPMPAREAPQADNGDTRYVVGTNQHGQANAAYIPATSHFAQAGQ